MSDTNYGEYFKPELDALDVQYDKSEKLYDEVHRGMSKNLSRMENRTMLGGGGSPYRDISELGKVLNDIRANQVSTIKEKSNIKKTIKELELKNESIKKNDKDNTDAQVLMKELISSIQSKNADLTKITSKDRKSSLDGLDKLNNLDPEKLGINENDIRMIEKFKKSK